MKQICVIYDKWTGNEAAVLHNQQILEELFGDLIAVRNYGLHEMDEDEVLEGDAFLLSNQMLLSGLRRHILDFKKIIIMGRSIQKAAITETMKIPHDSDVLVVNDSYTSSSSTTYQLYQIGINHLNLIPFDQSQENTGIYRSLKYAVTTGELSHVPSYIDTVVDLKYRVISFSTMLELVNLLQFDKDRLMDRLIPYMNSIAMVDLGFHDNYRDSFLKNQMLDLVVTDADEGILVVTESYQHVYSNQQANRILHLQKTDHMDLMEYIDEDLEEMLRNSEDNMLIELSDEHYVLHKIPLYMMDELIGYCFTLQGEKDLRQMEINLNSHLRQKGLYAQHTFTDIIHTSAVMDQCISLAKQAAVTDHTILIRGESGTGKELLAQSIHNYSPRKNQPFVAINCASLPESLLESLLFGYDEGSFTGAKKKGKAGLFEQAHLGTIFLDEIGDISPNLQSQLLRVLQEKQIMRIGSDKIINVDVRIIAATNQNLEERMQAGMFRSDLFYRLNVIPLSLPPLRSRQEDILPLFQTFIGQEESQISVDMAQCLTAYDWPGNVRQLENTAIYFSTFHQLPYYLKEAAVTPSAPEVCTEYHPPEDLNRIILQLIANGTEPFHGPGRNLLLTQLASRNISISDGKLRHLLTDLESSGLITISRGRRGCQITNAGLSALQH
ncbi:MAG: sigma 54-interacting transcriptional regulator [Firmicutes bacterium]|nr:sigma 54-interacting transcriptional regulator [Bacillota bacterium]